MQATAYAHEAASEVFKACADPTRVRVLALLAHAGELCVCHVESALGITQSRASRHLAALRRAGLVTDRRDGAWVHYSVRKGLDPLRRAVVRSVRDATAEDPVTGEDVARATGELRTGTCGGASAGGAR